jgi:hypothetical protein
MKSAQSRRIVPGITGFLDFAHCPAFKNKTTEHLTMDKVHKPTKYQVIYPYIIVRTI